MAPQRTKMMDDDLPTHEWQRARAAYSKVLGDKRCVTSNFELQNICAELGLQPSLEEIERAIEANSSSMDFQGLLRFVRYMKVKFHTPDPKDMETVLCFVAVGGALDKTGEVQAETLKQACRRFDLAIDIDRLIDEKAAAEADGDKNTLSFREFGNIFDEAFDAVDQKVEPKESPSMVVEDTDLLVPRPPPQRLKLGYDFQALLAREMGDKGLPMPRARRATDLLTQPQPVRKRSTIMRQSYSHHHGDSKENRNHRELRAKGVPPALYGGAEPTSELDVSHTELKLSGKSPGRKRRQQSGPETGKLNKSSPQAILGANTRIVGRTGLFVDDPPRLYPQHMAATAVPQLPPLDGKSPRRRHRMPHPPGEKSRIIQSIERRIEEIGKRKLGSKYRNVSSRWNEGTLSARSAQSAVEPRPPATASSGERPAPRPQPRQIQSR
eukprot:Hpha_TRINITY_DN16693_c2_g5::TRINITY_DN16693_c2_g5_i1::g.180592::m.180592